MLDGGVPTGSTPGFDPGNLGWYDGAPGGYSQELIDNAAAVPASFDIEVSFDINPAPARPGRRNFDQRRRAQ